MKEFWEFLGEDMRAMVIICALLLIPSLFLDTSTRGDIVTILFLMFILLPALYGYKKYKKNQENTPNPLDIPPINETQTKAKSKRTQEQAEFDKMFGK